MEVTGQKGSEATGRHDWNVHQNGTVGWILGHLLNADSKTPWKLSHTPSNRCEAAGVVMLAWKNSVCIPEAAASSSIFSLCLQIFF